MLNNQKGDALTLAMGAAVFVGISVMVTIAVLSNLDAKVLRSRMVNDVDSMLLSMNQVLNNRDLCSYALRQNNGFSILLNAIAPPSTIPVATKEVLAVPRLYLTDPVPWNGFPTRPPLFCAGVPDANGDGVAEPNPDANCPQQHNMVIRDIQYEFRNDIWNNKAIFYRGSSTRYRLISGQLEVDIDFASGMVIGGDLKRRSFPLQIVVDTTGDGGAIPPGYIEMCFTRESPALICAQLGGSLDPASGQCSQMFGQCGVPPNMPTTCGTLPGNSCTDPALKWTTLYYASTVGAGMQVHCSCTRVCTVGP